MRQAKLKWEVGTMGDRCYMELTLRRQDVEKLEGLGYEPSETDDQGNEAGPVTTRWNEINYGGSDLRADLSALGVPFHGYHGEGSGYGAYRFYSTGDGTCATWATNYDGGLTIEVSWTGHLWPDDIENVREFIWNYSRVELIVDDGWPADTLDQPGDNEILKIIAGHLTEKGGET